MENRKDWVYSGTNLETETVPWFIKKGYRMMILRLRPVAAAAFSVWALSTFSALTVLTPPSLAQTIPGKFYEYRILSMIGQTPLNAGQPLTSMSGPSVNSNGTVAFAAVFMEAARVWWRGQLPNGMARPARLPL
jgi:hypothetical protein